MAFNDATRQKITRITPGTRVSGAQYRMDLPRVGLLARIYGLVRGTTNAVTSGPNALGLASIMSRIRLQANNGQDIFNLSGEGYHYGLRPYLDNTFDPNPQSNARSAVTATTAVVDDFIIPVAVNLRDPVGLIMLQNEQTLLTLTLDWQTDALVATGGITWTTQPVLTPYLEWFTVPAQQADWPPTNIVHQCIEDKTTVAASGTFTYAWPRGNTYLQLIHGLGWAAAGADGFSAAQLRANYSDFIRDIPDPTFFDIQNPLIRGQQRIAGTIPWDLVSTSGLGVYDQLRDTIDTRQLTALDTVLTATGAGTLYSIRRQLITLA